MKTIAIAGGLLASAVLLTGCGLGDLAGPTNQDTTSYEVTDKVTKLQLESHAGDTVVTETDGTAIRVVEKLRWRGDDKPKPEHKVEGGALFVTYDCASNWGSCSVDYEIEVPKGLAVDLDSGSGNITLRALTGDIDVHVGSGDVDASDLAGKRVVAEAGSGNVELKYTTVPTSAQLKAGSGDIVLNVPDGAYDVKTETGSGDATVSVKDDGSSPNKISLSAGSGNVSVLPG
ncbi:DUF4097 family beta strand repeat-containing protein [Nonomuraea turcica]|uniref:DUF4097 family beta strand repeat-containing protein n=1 Tax=Nonomuraea sp. G32 TaxID=3067274 RepID=UPI00273AB64C|nr:DUF4097 family beta strand repeat-containing protein [Nonomuraea sp. G32]MDP4509786.1 DUF4097 family beta strand repeat-containing protein [Nonomuraea sp. G32]